MQFILLVTIGKDIDDNLGAALMLNIGRETSLLELGGMICLMYFVSIGHIGQDNWSKIEALTSQKAIRRKWDTRNSHVHHDSMSSFLGEFWESS
jgi:hypothetical protein